MTAKSKVPLKPFNPNVPPFVPTLPYLGALIDGEGTIGLFRSCQTGTRYQVRVAISQKYLFVVLRQIHEVFGGYLYNYERKRDNCLWMITGNSAVNLLVDVYPFLIGKYYQAQLAINTHGKKMSDPEAQWSDLQLRTIKKRVLL